ncbi:hypothetical protein C8J57DRAFT_1254521 [Mycena rebaudengoi]|nr:hypothetical protein C8J57DRAFT_1254521 [Mycena rebaudengoi]
MISDRNPEVHFYIVKVAAVENCRCIVAVLPQSAADIEGSIGYEDGMEFGSSTVNMSLVRTLESAADAKGSIGYEDGTEFGSSTVHMSLVLTSAAVKNCRCIVAVAAESAADVEESIGYEYGTESSQRPHGPLHTEAAFVRVKVRAYIQLSVYMIFKGSGLLEVSVTCAAKLTAADCRSTAAAALRRQNPFAHNEGFEFFFLLAWIFMAVCIADNRKRRWCEGSTKKAGTGGALRTPSNYPWGSLP